MTKLERQIIVGTCDNLLDGVTNCKVLFDLTSATVETDAKRGEVKVKSKITVLEGLHKWYDVEFYFTDYITKMRLLNNGRRFYTYDFSLPCEENTNNRFLSRLWEE